jgi:hypothetical protein
VAFVLRKSARPGDPIEAGRRPVPEAPGAVKSPQIPGQVPDRSEVPGEGVLPVPAAVDPRPPTTEFGTAQRIARLYAPKDGNDDDPARFELGPTSYEERRNAYPALGTPKRPTAGYQLGGGTRLSLAPAAVSAGEAAGEIAPGQ